MAISVTDPIERSISRSKYITFQPFYLGKWFVLGFVAFLASLGEGGGGGNFNVPGGGGGGRAPAPMPGPGPGMPGHEDSIRVEPALPEPVDEIWAWITAHVMETVLIALGIFLV